MFLQLGAHTLNDVTGLTQVDKDAFVEWVQREKLPAYLPFTDDNQEVIFNSGIKINVRAAW